MLRWRYYNDHNHEESAQRDAVRARIRAWWGAFENEVKQDASLFERQSQSDLPQFMLEHLNAIHPAIMWEYGPAVHCDGDRLVLTPESAHHLHPLVAEILRLAPKMPGWEFYNARLPEDLDWAKASVKGRAAYDISDFRVRVSIGQQRRIDLCYYSPRIDSRDDQRAFDAAFVATESLLGERCLDRWIGAIEISPFPQDDDPESLERGPVDKPRHSITLDRLKATVDAVIESMRDQLPPMPHHEWAQTAEWTLWELKPEPADDYPQQNDLFVGKSAIPPMWMAARSRATFYSERFTRHGETFCYVKIDGAEGLIGSSFSDKSEIEDAINEVLIPSGLGCQVGGGMGMRYAYVDLALTDVPTGITAIRNRLQAGAVPKRSWIQFFDADLATEWVGIYDDTPPPPMPELD